MESLLQCKGLLAGMSIESLRGRTAREPYKKYWDQMTARWREVAAWEAQTGEVRYIGACGGGMVCWLAREAALIHRLTGDAEALEFVHKQIDKLAYFYIDHRDEREAKYGNHYFYWSHMQVCLAADMIRESLDEGRRQRLLRMVREQFMEAPLCGWDTIHRFLGGHNIPFTEQVCAGICALTWGEEAGRADWEKVVNHVRDACVVMGRQGYDRQGYPYEGTMYGVIPMEMMYLFAQLLHQNGRENLFDAIPVMKLFPRAMLSMIFPDRTAFVPLMDGGIGNPKSWAWLLLTAKHYNRPEDLGFWNEYRGPARSAEPTANNNPPPMWPRGSERGPVRRDGWGQDLYPCLWWDADAPVTPIDKTTLPTSNHSPGLEVINFRTGWGRDAVYVNVSGQGRSLTAIDHTHSDCGHFTLFAHGDYLAIDPGYWNIREDQHSVVMVEGKPTEPPPGREHCLKHRRGVVRDYQRHALLDYALVDAANVNGCVWSDRHVLFVRLGGDDAYFVTLDNITPDHRRHTFWWQLQAHPESTVAITGPTTAAVARRRARLDVTFVSPPASDFPTCPPELKLRGDWIYGAYIEGHGESLKGAAGISKDYIYTEEEARREKNDLTFSSFYRPRLIAEQTGPSCLLLTVMSPRRISASTLPVRVVPAKRVFRVEVESDRYVDTIVAALNHGYLTMPDIRGFTELALIRRDKKGKLVDSWTVDGSRLELKT